MFVSPQMHMLNPNPNPPRWCLVGRAFGRRLGHEGGALMGVISALIKETPKSILAPSCHVKIQREDARQTPEGGFSPRHQIRWYLDLDLQFFRTEK